MRLIFSFNISGDHEDWQNNEPVEIDKDFKRSLLGAKYKEAIEVEDYSVAEGIMRQLKQD